jgi:hypothetical protein
MLLKKEENLKNGYKNKQRMADIHNIPCSLCYKLGLRQRTPTQAHHKVGLGLGKKASDNLSMALCFEHHQSGNNAIHHIGSKAFERKFCSQDELIEITDQLLNGM